jgi:hypothetical protein
MEADSNPAGVDDSVRPPDGDEAAETHAAPTQWTMVREDGVWRIAGVDDGERTLQIEAEDWVRRFGGLRVLGIADPGPGASEPPVMTFTVTDGEGDKTYRFYRPDPDDDYVVVASHHHGAFRAGDYLVDRLRRERDSLVAAAASPAGTGNERSAHGVGGVDSHEALDADEAADRDGSPAAAD